MKEKQPYINNLIAFASAFVISFLLFKNCESPKEDYNKFMREKKVSELNEKIKTETMKYNVAKMEIKEKEKYIDSLKKVSVKVETRYKNIHDTVFKMIERGECDTNIVKEFANDCNTAIKFKDVIIKNQDTLIEKYSNEIKRCDTLLSTHLNLQNETAKENEANKKELKKQKRKTKVAVFVIAVLTGVGTVLAIK